jgi:hypothetical protein
VRLLRDNVVIHEGKLKTLKRFKDEVKEVPVGQECGMAFENYEDIREGRRHRMLPRMSIGGKDIKPVIEALTRNKKYIRAEVAHTLNLRYAPDLKFREDETFEEATRIDRLLDSPKVRQDVEKK